MSGLTEPEHCCETCDNNDGNFDNVICSNCIYNPSLKDKWIKKKPKIDFGLDFTKRMIFEQIKKGE